MSYNTAFLPLQIEGFGISLNVSTVLLSTCVYRRRRTRLLKSRHDISGDVRALRASMPTALQRIRRGEFAVFGRMKSRVGRFSQNARYRACDRLRLFVA